MKNSSGIQPLEFNVLVKPIEVQDKTDGGLYLPDDVKTKDKNATRKGTLVDLSPMAFSWSEWPEDKPKPKPGDQVIFARYAAAASQVKGEDGVEYWIMKDADLMALVAA